LVFSGSEVIDDSEWSLDSGTPGVDAVYSCSYPTPGINYYHPTAIFVNSVPLTAVASLAACQALAGSSWTDTATETLYVRLADSNAPQNGTDFIERPRNQFCFASQESTPASAYAGLLVEGVQIGPAASKRLIFRHYISSCMEPQDTAETDWSLRIFEFDYVATRLDSGGGDYAIEARNSAHRLTVQYGFLHNCNSDSEMIHIGTNPGPSTQPLDCVLSWLWIANTDAQYSNLEQRDGPSTYKCPAVINRGDGTLMTAITAWRTRHGLVYEGEDGSGEASSAPHRSIMRYCYSLDSRDGVAFLNLSTSVVCDDAEIRHCGAFRFTGEGFRLTGGAAGWDGLIVRDVVVNGDGSGGNPMKFESGGDYSNTDIRGLKMLDVNTRAEWAKGATLTNFYIGDSRIWLPDRGASAWISANSAPTGTYNGTTIGDGTMATAQTPYWQDTNAEPDLSLIPSGGIIESQDGAVNLTLNILCPSSMVGFSYELRISTADPVTGGPPDFSTYTSQSHWADEVHVAAPYWDDIRTGTVAAGANNEVFTYSGLGTEVPGYAQAIVYDDSGNEVWTSLPVPVLLDWPGDIDISSQPTGKAGKKAKSNTALTAVALGRL
jgi:hypothetical protein